MTDNSGGLLGKLLLPGYTDAGASTTFQTPNPPADSGPTPLSDGRNADGDVESEAGTEIRDNRTSTRQQRKAPVMASMSSNESPTKEKRTPGGENATVDSTDLGESKYSGFFPSTKPEMSPRPQSPPEVTRQRLPNTRATSVAGTSVIPETGASYEAPNENQTDKHNQTRFQFWNAEGDNTSTNAEPSTSSNHGTLNAANLQTVEEQFAAAEQETTSDESSAERPNRDTSLLGADEDVGSEVAGSEALSTASEMGTIIETGNSAARMAEIDAMAALIEASPNVDQLTPRPAGPPPPSQIPQHRSGPSNRYDDDPSHSLALPILENRPIAEAPKVMLQSKTKQPASSTALPPATEMMQEPDKTVALANPTASEMLTSAIRRIGSGVNKAKASLSAPPTPKTPGIPAPPKVEDLLKSTLTPRGTNVSQNQKDPNQTAKTSDLPPSLALRSPGSSARISLRQNQNQVILTPRFSSGSMSGQGQSMDIRHSLSADYHGASSSMSRAIRQQPQPSLHQQLAPMSPFRLAQKCFSFDSTLDDLPESATSSQLLKLEDAPAPRTKNLHRSPRPSENRHHLKYAASWDVGRAAGPTDGPSNGNGVAGGAFRAQPHRSFRIGGLQQTESQHEHNAQRARFHSDTLSPSRLEGTGRDADVTMELQTPQRVMDVEREDALDILACLVERGVAAWSDDDPSTIATTETTRSPGQSDDESKTESTPEQAPSDCSQFSEALVASMVKEIRDLSSREDNKDDHEKDHKRRMAALDELLKSHSYALEMKRAAQSASTWLKSIGRGTHSSPSDEEKGSPPTTSEGGQASGENDASKKTVKDGEVAVDSKLEMLTLRARLHRAQAELQETNHRNRQLDLELSKCRAEIGRLQIASRSEQDLPTNRSILDEVENEESTTSKALDRSQENRPPSPIAREASGEEKLFDESFQGNNSLFHGVSEKEEKERQTDVKALDSLVMNIALEQANETIRKLHGALTKDQPEAEREAPPVVDIPETGEPAAVAAESNATVGAADASTPKAKADAPTPEAAAAAEAAAKVMSPSADLRTVNVRMLDGENFVTEWDNLTPPLPPPPDHGLRSPIVNTVLEQWTTDPALHDSLLAWMERVMTGDELESSVPPLTISSLDHQVRDGFVMHVLPLLLRRADIHVEVKMRAHRQTTYDLSVTVNQELSGSAGHGGPGTRSPSSLLDQHAHDEWMESKYEVAPSAAPSISHSALTDQIVNGGSRYNTQFRNISEETEYSHFGIPHPDSLDMDDTQQQPTIMGALGGALGGLISRRKYSASSPARFPPEPSGSFPAALRASIDLTASPVPSTSKAAEMDDQPYHRVVSAPPGRIGVTFVEFRGHAMVSDVAPDSPLNNWVYPSDILIAVDEVPVSGMRVRDIIKVLTSRRDRQRALRVISSHAMHEFTLNQSQTNLDDESP